MEANKILNSDYLDIIFEGRNKDYGAYDLRKTYNKRLAMALIIMGAIIAFIFIAYLVSNAMANSKNNKNVVVQDVQLQEVKREEKKERPPPRPPPKPPPPKVEITKFTPPKIV